MNSNLKPILSAQEIESIVETLAARVNADYASKDPVLVGVLKGAFVFVADLVRRLDIPFEVDYIQTASYGKKTGPATEVLITRDMTTDIKGRDVIIVEGIVDSGKTVRALLHYFNAKGPLSVRLCSLLVRDTLAADITIDYFGTRIGHGFVAGYGMDYKEHYRGLSGIYIVTD
ncbi:MAG: hypoxanthine phosphoribosyltransferase [Deltaproteobacteria bacterium]|nr:hypoxanthine phosphoribosyltransferase [Deltaproteobacteria bacterium]